MIRKRALQSSNPVVAVYAGNDLGPYVDDVPGVDTVWIPAWLRSGAINNTRDVCSGTTVSSEVHGITSRRGRGNLAPNEVCINQRRTGRNASQPDNSLSGISGCHPGHRMIYSTG